MSFQTSLTQIESLIDTLEHENTSLEESLLVFEKGVGLTREAQKALVDAEQKVQTLLGESGGPIVQDFAEEDIDQ